VIFAVRFEIDPMRGLAHPKATILLSRAPRPSFRLSGVVRSLAQNG